MLVPKLRFKEFTGEWKISNIGSLAKCIAGATPNTKTKEYWENGTIPWLSSGEVNKKRIYFTNNFITQLGFSKSSTKFLPKNTVVIALAGQGKTRGLVGITELELCTNQSLCGIVTNNIINDEYLYQRLIVEYENLRFISSGDGTRGGLNLKIISDYKISFPPLNEQNEIANFLSLLDKKIELQTKKIEVLKLYSESIKHQIMFIKDNTKKEYKLSNLLHEENYKSTVNNQYPILSSTNKGIFLQEEYFIKQAASTDNIGYKVLKKNQLVFSPQNLWMGNININFKYDIGIVSPSYKIFKVNDNVCDINYFNEWIKTKEALYSYILASEQGASIVRRNLNIDLFNEILILLPDDNKQKEYGKLFNTINNKLQLENTKLSKLIELKKGLMQNIFV